LSGKTNEERKNQMATETKRFETKAEAFEYSMTAGGLIFAYGSYPDRFRLASQFTPCDFYVVPLTSLEWAESLSDSKTGLAELRLVTDYSDLMA
jgi:hypothetical protein